MIDSLHRSDLVGKDSPQSSHPITEADVLMTGVLASRPARQPDFAAESQALRTLAQHLMDEPQSMLKTLVRLALDLCRADTVGVSLLETTSNGESVFRWVAIAGALEPFEQGTTPGSFSPCGTTLACNQPQLYSYPERFFTYLYHPQFPVVEGLLIPLHVNDRPLGTLWIISHTDARHFDTEDQRLMMSLGGFTAAALYSMQKLQQTAATALRQSEQFNQQILESSDDCIKVLDLEGRIVLMSPAGQALLGIQDITPFLNTSWAEFWQGADQQAAIEAIAQARVGKVATFQGYRPTLSGEPKWWDSKVSSIRGAEGQIERLLCISRDITERKQAEAVLRESERESQRLEAERNKQLEIFDTVLARLQEFVYLFDLEGRFRYVNKPLLDLWGLTLDQAVGKNFFDLGYPDELVRLHEAQIRQVIETAQSLEGEATYTNPAGVIGQYEYIFVPLLAADGSVEAVGGRTQIVTERRLAEAALRASEAKYRTLFNSMDEGFCIIEVLFDQTGKADDYRFLEVNPAFEKHTGLVNAIGKTICELVPQHDAHWFEIYGKIALTGEAARFENRAEELKRFYDVYAFRIGEPHEHKVATLFNDISERKQAEERLHRAAKLDAFRVSLADALRPLAEPVEVQATAARVLGEYLNANRVAYFEVRGANYVVERDYVNGAALLAGGYSIDSFGPKLLAAYRAGRTVCVSDVSTDANLSPQERSAYAAIQIGAYIGIPLVKGGEFVAGLAIHTSEPRVWTPDEVALAEEVAERTWAAVDRARAEAFVAADLEDTQLLRELGARLVTEGDIQTLYQEIMSAAIALTKADAGTVQLFDVATQDLVLLATQGFEQNMTEHFYRVNASFNTSCGIALKKGIRSFVDFDVPESEDPSGSMRLHVEAGYLSAQSTPLTTRAGRLIGMVSTHWHDHHRPSARELRFLDLLARQAADLIEQRQTAAEREQLLARAEAARAEADRANRIKDEFLAVLSHELRSPLNPILGWAKLLQNGKLDAAKTQQALKTIERNAQLQSELIEDLLDVSRILQGKLNLNVSSINLVSIIRAAMETVRLAAEAKSIKLEASLEPDVGLVWGDSTRLQQVIWNLLSNAVKFTPAGGHVNIRLERLDSYAHIIVSDTGQGIEPDFLPYVFDYFRQANATTTRKFGGLGLGLAIVRNLVELHGGTAGVESLGVGKGATFTVRLPVMPIQSSANQNGQSSKPSSDLNGIQVLVVDDEPDSREFVAFVLEQAGANVLTATTADEALTMLIRSEPNVLLSDIGMPDMDGYMLMQQVRALPPDQGGQVLAIALTAYAGDFNQQQALRAGFQQHVSKPLEPETLIQVISSLIKSAIA
ncbi:PAS domain-containing protein [Microcoleus sp. FACHB-53]|nr:PAS domain-containing protein [Microcoleus sp. FACHB-53]